MLRADAKADLMQSIGPRNYSKPYWGSLLENDDQPTGEDLLRAPEAQGSLESISPRKEVDLNQMTIAEFVRIKFLPEHIATKRTSGRRHYQAILKHVLPPEEVDRIFGIETSTSKAKLKAIVNWPYLTNVQLRDAHPDHVQSLVSAALESGYSTQTAKHIRNVVSAVFTHAIKVHYFAGENPALPVTSPGMRRKIAHALTFEQAVRVLYAMRYPEMEIALLAMLTGMNVAEICGLQWKDVNLAKHSVNRGGELIPPMTIAVRDQWYRGELSNVPAARRKSIAIPPLIHSIFFRLSNLPVAGWNDFVFVSKRGRPINQINVAARRIKSIGAAFEMPWLSWQVFRRTRLSLIQEFGAQFPVKLSVAMTMKLDPQQPTVITQGPRPFPK
jgi:integrase